MPGFPAGGWPSGDITCTKCGSSPPSTDGKYWGDIARKVFTWLLRADASGRRWAMARRLGVMYIIHNRRIWGSYRADEGWRPYVGTNPHTDHVHFSFSWAGARKQTSYWDGSRVTYRSPS